MNSCKLLIQSLVISILDYCNILLINLPVYQLMPLHKIIRSSMCVLYKLPPRSIYDTTSITELILQQHLLLHWLLQINIYIYIYIYDIFSIVNKTILYDYRLKKRLYFLIF